MKELNIQCITCKESLYDSGELIPTSEGYFVRCKSCNTVYLMSAVTDYEGRRIVYLDPVSLSQEAFEKEFQTKVENSLLSKIQAARTPKDLINSLQENSY